MLANVAGWPAIVRAIFLTTVCAGALLRVTTPAQAQIGSERYSSIVIDAASGNVVSAANADELRFPASLTKMMTLYILFEAIRDRRISLNQYVPVSTVASSMPPTKLGLVPGSIITVEQCILGLVTKSANDAASALGELLGGDEDRFAQMMTLRARALGMTRSTFRNASGLPDWGQVTTARDMAILARHLIQDFPGYYAYFSTPSFTYGGRRIYSHQAMLRAYAGADGLKTGYTDASGFNVVTSAVHSDTRLIGVVMGAASSGERNAHMANLLDQGFEREGVPQVAYAARREPAFQLPSIISRAQARPIEPMVAPRMSRSTVVARRAPEPAIRRAAEPAARPKASRAVTAARRAPETKAPRSIIYAPAAPARAEPRVSKTVAPVRPDIHGTAGRRYPG